jgi:hypothetical protein
MAAMSFLVAGTWGMSSVIGLVVAVNLLDAGMQCGQIANQTRIFGLGEEIRGRLNTVCRGSEDCPLSASNIDPSEAENSKWVSTLTAH